MEHLFEEYSTEIIHNVNPINYVLVIASSDDATNLCTKLLDLGYYVLCNKPLLKHMRFIHLAKNTNQSYYIHRIYNS